MKSGSIANGGAAVDGSRKANREDDEKTLQYQSRPEALSVEELNEEKVTDLLACMSRLEQIPSEAAELQRRVKVFGDCKRSEGESAVEFYARLRHWIVRDVLTTKPQLHAPRQTDN
jgi:hypothetical protein